MLLQNKFGQTNLKLTVLLTPSKWAFNIGDHGWGNNELQYYTDELKNARVENGILIIEAHADINRPKGYTSARIVTKGKAAWTYGYFEIKQNYRRRRNLACNLDAF